MRAWICRNADGEPRMFVEPPTWKNGIARGWPDFWSGDLVTRIYTDDAERIAQDMNVQAGERREIELTARPVGEAEGGGS